MNLNEIILKNPAIDGFREVPEVWCKDGFHMSVQASHFHYCSPRNDVGPYSAVEVGFPSRKELTLMPYVEPHRNPTQAVYGWVPVEVIEAIIEKHGGIGARVKLPIRKNILFNKLRIGRMMWAVKWEDDMCITFSFAKSMRHARAMLRGFDKSKCSIVRRCFNHNMYYNDREGIY